MTLAEQAINYASHNIPVFPTKPLDKTPLTRHGHRDATTMLAQIDEWWEQWPEANIATPTGVTVVIDIDVKEDRDGYETFAGLGLVFPPTLVQHTPTGGLHVLFQHPRRGRTIRNASGALWIRGERVPTPGIDIRGAGGYILVSPSRTEAGVYVWDERKAKDAAPAPGWFWADVRSYDWPTREPGGEYDPDAPDDTLWAIYTDMENAEVGERNDTLNLCAYRLGKLTKQGRVEDPVAALERLSEIAVESGLTAREVEKTIKSGFTAGAER